MKASLHPNLNSEHHLRYMKSLKEGIERCGDTAVIADYDTAPDASCDLSVIWSYKQKQVINSGTRVLVMEHGYLPERQSWISLTLDGIAGRGLATLPPQGAEVGKRAADYFAKHVKPWRKYDAQGHVLVIGQFPKDSVLPQNFDMHGWVNETCSKLSKSGHRVIYRPHPLWEAMRREKRPEAKFEPLGANEVSDSIGKTLKDDLENCKFCVTYSSNSAVESVLMGVATVAMSTASMAYGVTSHTLNAKDLIRPNRQDWLHELSWAQWKERELRDGTAWTAVKNRIRQSVRK